MSSPVASVALMTLRSVETRLAFVKIHLRFDIIIHLTNEVGAKHSEGCSGSSSAVSKTG